MPILKRPDGEIHYQTYGERVSRCCCSRPADCARAWRCGRTPPGGPPRSWVDWTKALPEAGFTAVAMDQRNAGASRTDDRGRPRLAYLRRGSSGADGPSGVRQVPRPGRLHRRQLLPEGGRDGAETRCCPRCCRTRSVCIRNTPTTSRTATSNGARNSCAERPDLNARPSPRSGATCGTVRSCSASIAAFVRELPGADIPAARHRYPASGRDQRRTGGAAARCRGADRVARPGFLEAQRNRVVAFLKANTPLQ